MIHPRRRRIQGYKAMVSNALHRGLKYGGILKEEYGPIILPARTRAENCPLINLPTLSERKDRQNSQLHRRQKETI